MDGIKFRPETTDITFNDVKGVSNSFLEFITFFFHFISVIYLFMCN